MILAAEDEETDALLLRLAFEQARLPCELIVARDGEEAVRYLNGDEPYSDRIRFPMPCVVLLDLKMPRMDGFDVLKWIADHPQFKGLPALVLSSSTHDSDVERARRLGAREFLVKPHAFMELVQLVRDVYTRCVGTVSPAGR